MTCDVKRKHLAGRTHVSYWSADFLQDVRGDWWLIDMACGIDSEHWPGCGRAVLRTDDTLESKVLRAEGRGREVFAGR